MPCRDRHEGTLPMSLKGYSRGFRACTMCDRVFRTDGERCPCCSHKFRLVPRNHMSDREVHRY